MRWSIVIFCYNEVESLEKTFHEVESVIKRLSDDWQIIIVDDGSSDGSREIAERLRDTYKVELVAHEVNLGIGQALRSGYTHATGYWVCAVPADGQFDLNELLLIGAYPQNSFVSFYRKENLQYSLFRNILSLINKELNAIFLKMRLKDVNWVKVYPNHILKTLELKINSSLIESEICAKLIHLGYTPIEVPSKYQPRFGGVSKGASFRIVRQAAIETVKLIAVHAAFVKKKRLKA